MQKKKYRPADRDSLSIIHRLLCLQMIQRLRMDIRDNVPTDAATISAMTKFLKDNEITADPADKSDLGDARKLLMQQSEARRRLASVTSIAPRDIAQDVASG